MLPFSHPVGLFINDLINDVKDLHLGIKITDDLTKANLLNNLFVSESTFDESRAQLPPNPPHSQYTINKKVITQF